MDGRPSRPNDERYCPPCNQSMVARSRNYPVPCFSKAAERPVETLQPSFICFHERCFPQLKTCMRFTGRGHSGRATRESTGRCQFLMTGWEFCGTGVFYQAMPAVGADGKNIMKLIPVQMINGQFVHTKRSKPSTDPTPQKAVTVSVPVRMVQKATLNPSCQQQVVRRQVSLANALPNPVGLDLPVSLNKHPLMQQTVNLIANVPPMAASAADCEMSVRLLSHLPVTVKSPALPRGQYLQIPPNAHVRTVPASDLPLGIKKQIFTSSANSCPGSGLPSVIYVSPITTVNQSVTPPSDPTLPSLKLLSKTSHTTSCGPPSKGSLKLIPKVSQRPNSPIKWTIEEDDTSTAPALCPSVTSEILQAVAERERSSKHGDVIAKPVSQSSQSSCGQELENALLMCNGKVFFVARKCSSMGISDLSTASTKSFEFNKTIVPSSQQSLESVAPQTKKDLQIIIPDGADEVIDLCDDDAQDDSSQQAASVNMSAVTPVDEDNVIFVSYIPPRSEETHRAGTSSSNSGDEASAGRGRKPGQSMSVPPVRRICSSAVMDMHHNEGSDINGQQSTSTHQLASMEVDVETESAADPSSSAMCSPTEKDVHSREIFVNPPTSVRSSVPPKSCQKADHLLRQVFGITADVTICLRRIDEASAGSVPAEPRPIRSAEHHQEPSNGSTERKPFLRDPYSPQETDCDKPPIERVKELTEQELPADSAQSPRSHIGPLKCSHLIINTKPLSALKNECHSGQGSLMGTPCDVETEPVIGYVEPIDEDFLATDANDIPSSRDTVAWPQTQHVDLSTNTRRMGRKRKRTTCPCCIPGTRDPAMKAGAKAEELGEWAWTTSKKGGRTKGPRQDVTTSGRISCLTVPKSKRNCKTYEVPTRDSLCSTLMDCSDLERQEQIQRVKELLKENEAALELMRKGVS